MWPWQVFVFLVGVQSVEYFVTDRSLEGETFQPWKTRLDKLCFLSELLCQLRVVERIILEMQGGQGGLESFDIWIGIILAAKTRKVPLWSVIRSSGSSQQDTAKAGSCMKATLWFQAPMTMSLRCNAKHLGKVGCGDPTTSWRLPILSRMMLTCRSSLLRLSAKSKSIWILQPCFWN